MLSMHAEFLKRTSSQHQRFGRTALSIAVLSCFTANILANPTGANVVAGQATFQQVAGKLVIQNVPNTIINWQQFNIGRGEVTQFIQQNANSSVLNRVVGGDLSQILGALQSNGRVFLINPNGILFGQGARIDVAGLVASTLNISNQDFLSGKLNFASQGADAFIKNQGEIVAGQGGQIVLVSPNIENSGIIHAPNGDVLLAAGRSVTVVDIQKPAISIDVQAPATQAINVGSIIAGQVSVYGQLVRHEGLTEATGAVLGANGKVRLMGVQAVELTPTSILKADGDAGGHITVQSEQGTVLLSGVVQAQGASGVGGTIDLLGQQVGVQAGAKVSADGVSGGGQVHIGGGWQGQDTALQNANNAYIDASAKVSANALMQGNGGEVVVWSEQSTQINAQLQAKGGVLGGDGGRIETSSHGVLALNRAPDTSATLGKAGVLLLDPQDIEIVRPVSAPSPQPSSGSLFTPTANYTQISADVIVDSLVNNRTVVLSTKGSQATSTTGTPPTGRIAVNAPIMVPANTNSSASASSPVTYNLGLIAEGEIVINSPIGLADTTNNLLNLDLQFSKSGGGQLNAPLSLGAGALSYRHSTPSSTQAPPLTPQPLPLGFSINPKVNNSNNGPQTLALTTLVGAGSSSEVAPPLYFSGAEVTVKNFSSFGEVFVNSVNFGDGGFVNSRVALTDNSSIGRLVIAPNNTVELGASPNPATNGSAFNFAGLGTAAPSIANSGNLFLKQNLNGTQASLISQSGIVNAGSSLFQIGSNTNLISSGFTTNAALKIDAGGVVNIFGNALLSNTTAEGMSLDSAGNLRLSSSGKLSSLGNAALRTGSYTQIDSGTSAVFTDYTNAVNQLSRFTLEGTATLNVDGTALLGQTNNLLYGNLSVSREVQVGSSFLNSSTSTPSTVDFGYGQVNINPDASVNLGISSVQLNNSTINISPGAVLNASSVKGLSFDQANINLNGNLNNPALQNIRPEGATGAQLIVNTLASAQSNVASKLTINANNYDNFIGNFSDIDLTKQFTIGQGVHLNVNGPVFASQPQNTHSPTLSIRSQSLVYDPIFGQTNLQFNGFVNAGNIQINSGTLLIDASSYGNFGGIRIGPDGNLSLAAPTRTSDIQAIQREAGSNLTLSKALDNRNAVLDLGATGNIRARNALAITGGSVLSTNANALNVLDDSFLQLNGVNVAASINVGNAAGVQLASGAQLNNASISFDRGYGVLVVDGPTGQTAELSGTARINANTPGNFILASNGATTLEIARGITIVAAGDKAASRIPLGLSANQLAPSSTTLRLGKVTPEFIAAYQYSPVVGVASFLPFSIPAISQNIVNNGNITITSGAISFGGPSLTNQATGSIRLIGGTLVIDPEVNTIINRGFMQLNQNLLTTGTLLNESTGTLQLLQPISIRPAFANYGTVSFAGGDVATNLTQKFLNAGNVTFNQGTYNFSGGYDQIGGVTSLLPGAVVDCSGSQSGMRILSGTLRGIGTINGFVQIGTNDSQAFLSPGFSPGAFTVNGDLLLGSNNTTQIELGGTQAGIGYDAINVSGQATLGGTLSLTSINGFVPQPSDNFTVLSYTNVAGQFARQVFNQPLQSANFTFGPNGTLLSNVVVAVVPVPILLATPLPNLITSQSTPPPILPTAQATSQVNDTVLAQTVRPFTPALNASEQQAPTESGGDQPSNPVIAAVMSSGPVNNIRLEPKQNTQRIAASCR